MLLGRLGVFTENFIPLGDVLWGGFCSGVLCWASFVRGWSTEAQGPSLWVWMWQWARRYLAVSKKVPKFFCPCPLPVMLWSAQGCVFCHSAPHVLLRSSAIGKQLSVQGDGSAGTVPVTQAWGPKFNPLESMLKKAVMIACTCNPSAGERWDRILGAHFPESLIKLMESGLSERLCLKDSWCWPLTRTSSCSSVHTQACVCEWNMYHLYAGVLRGWKILNHLEWQAAVSCMLWVLQRQEQ